MPPFFPTANINQQMDSEGNHSIIIWNASFLVRQYYFICPSCLSTMAHLKQVFQTNYELRSPLQHQAAFDLIASSHNHHNHACSLDKTKLLSFFATPLPIQEHEQPHEVSANSILIQKGATNGAFSMRQVQQPTIVHPQLEDIVLTIQGRDCLKCEALDWRSPEQEVKFMQSCPVLSEISKKRLFSVLRQCRVVKYRYGEMAYREGEPMKDCLYLVRSGEFSFSQKDPKINKAVEVLNFKAGYIFRHENNDKHRQKDRSHGRTCSSSSIRAKPSNFNYSVKCKSSLGTIYCIDWEFFDEELLPFCQDKLSKHIHNQLTYLGKNINKMEHRRSYSQVSLRQRPHSQQLEPFTAPLISSARQQHHPKEKGAKVLDLLQKPSDYFTVKETMPKRDRLFSKLQLRKIYPNPEEDESDALIWKKAKCDRLRQLTASKPRPLTRGQIFFEFTQLTIRFEKSRRKPQLV